MKIKKVIINNFRAFKHVEIELKDFNCIIGKNDSGKSTILAALEWFFTQKELKSFDTNANVEYYSEEKVSVEIHFYDLQECDLSAYKDYITGNEVHISKKIINPQSTDSDERKNKPYYAIHTSNGKNVEYDEEEWFENLEERCKFAVPIYKLHTPLTPMKTYLNELFDSYFHIFDDDKINNINRELSDEIKEEVFFSSIDCDFFPNKNHIPIMTSNTYISFQNRGDGFKQNFKNAVFRILSKKTTYGSYIFAFEEPETHLHPSAQLEMYDTIKELSKNNQVIITTHSPYIVKELAKDGIKPIVVKREGNSNESKIDNLSERVLPYISMNEINYIAFDEPLIEYHIELYGYMQNKLEQKNVKELDTWLKGKECSDVYDWYNTKKWEKETDKMTLPYCVRNNIDHPLVDDASDSQKHKAFTNNNQFNDREIIKKSIEIMRNAILSNPDDFKKDE